MEPLEEKEETFGTKTASIVYSISTGQFISTIIVLLTFVAITRMLQPEKYGLYSFAFGYSTLIDAFAAFGVGAYFTTKISIHVYKKEKEQIFNVMRAGFAVLIPIAVGLTLFGIVLSPYIANVAFASLGIEPITLMLASLTIFFAMVQAASSQALIGFGKGWYCSLVGTVTNAIQLVASVMLIVLGYGVNGAVAGMLIGYIVGTGMGIYYMFRFSAKYGKFKLFIPARSDIKAAFDFSAPIGVNKFLTTALQNFSIIFLGLYVTTATLGNYGAAVKGYNFMFFVYQTMTTILVPAFSIASVLKMKDTLHASYNSLLRYSMLLTLPLVVYPAVFAGPAVYLFISKSYTTADIYLSLIAIGTAIGIVNSYLDSLMLAAGKTRKTMVYNVYSGIVQLILLVIIVPYVAKYGQIATVIGAILSIFFIGNIISNFLFIRGVRRMLKVNLTKVRMLRVFVTNAILGIILAAFLIASGFILPASHHSINDAIQLVLGLVVMMLAYPVIMVMLKVIDKDDLQSIKDATARLPVIKKPVHYLLRYTAHFLPS